MQCDDSMLGGEEDEDLEALVADCTSQVEAVTRVSQSQRPLLQEPPSRVQEPVHGSTVLQHEEFNQTHLSRLLEQNSKLFEIITRQQEQQGESSNNNDKRKFRDDISYNPQGPVLLLEEAYHLEDDAHSKIDTRLRQRLRPVNADPEEWWVKGAFDRCERPILGGSLYLDHIMTSSINDSTLCKANDRWAYTEIKNWLSRNSAVGRENAKRFKVREVTSDKFSMGIQTQWDNAETVWEVMDAGFNFLGAEWMIRNYSHAGLAMIRVLHDSRYFCGVTSSATGVPNPKEQRKILEQYFNKCLKVQPYAW